MGKRLGEFPMQISCGHGGAVATHVGDGMRSGGPERRIFRCLNSHTSGTQRRQTLPDPQNTRSLKRMGGDPMASFLLLVVGRHPPFLSRERIKNIQIWGSGETGTFSSVSRVLGCASKRTEVQILGTHVKLRHPGTNL